MNKCPRFMIEYAAFQKKSLETCSAMNAGIKAELMKRIERYIDMFRRGFITVDETMRLLSMPDTNEDMSEYITA